MSVSKINGIMCTLKFVDEFHSLKLDNKHTQKIILFAIISLFTKILFTSNY